MTPKRRGQMASYIARRKFLAALGGAAAAWPLSARAQQPAMPVIGWLAGERLQANARGLTHLFGGWANSAGSKAAPSQSSTVGARDAPSAMPRSRPSLSGSSLMSLSEREPKQRSRQSRRHRASRSCFRRPETRSAAAWLPHWRPGGNVTGLSNLGTDLAAKRIEILREVFPRLSRLAVMANADYSGGVTERKEIDAAARALGLEIIPLPIRRVADIASAFDGLKGRAEALYITGDPLMNLQRLRINIFALAARLPTMLPQREYLEAGLISYGPNFLDMNRRAADYVDKILRGAKPADLPVEQPTKFDLVINLITAKALGIEISPMLLARADEVIE